MEDIAKASQIYRIADNGSDVVVADRTAHEDGYIEIENDYQDFIGGDGSKELKLSSSYAEISAARQTQITRTYATYYQDDNRDVKIFVCPVSFQESVMLEYYRITINLDTATDPDYVLREGDSHSYVLRLVPRKALDEGVSHVWNVDEYWEKDASGNYAQCLAQPVSGSSDDYEFRWNTDGAVPMLQGRMKNVSDVQEWFDIIVENNVGVTNPTRINAVFTQVQS